MNAEYPTTDDVREDYALDAENGGVDTERSNAFDRWLAAHDATIRTEQAERDAVIAIESTEWTGGLATQHTFWRAEIGTDIAAAIRDAAKEEQ